MRHHRDVGFPVRLAAVLAVLAAWGVLMLVLAAELYKAIGR